MGSTAHDHQARESEWRTDLPCWHSPLQQGKPRGRCKDNSVSAAAHCDSRAVQVSDKHSATRRGNYFGGGLEHRSGQNQGHCSAKWSLQRTDVPASSFHECPPDQGAGNGSWRRVQEGLTRGKEGAQLPSALRRQADQHYPAEGSLLPVLVADDQVDLAYLDLARPNQQRGGGKMQAKRSARRYAGRNDWRVSCSQQSVCPRKRSFSGSLPGSSCPAYSDSHGCISLQSCGCGGNRTCPWHFGQLGKSGRQGHRENNEAAFSVENEPHHQVHSESIGSGSGCVGSVQGAACSQDHNILEVGDILIDDYSHEDLWLAYTAANVPGPGCPPNLFEEIFERGCSCLDACSMSKCSCASKPNYSADGLIVNHQNPVFECNNSCKCKTNECENRVVQRGPMSGLEVFQAGPKGLGLRTSVCVRKGQFICEYAGEILGAEEARLRAAAQGSDDNYILVVREHSGGVTTSTIVDPTCVGNIGRYANHSCEPTALMMPVRSNTLVPHLALFAAQDLEAGQEVTFDYAGGEPSPSLSLTACRCASGKCRGFLPWDPSLL